jgi:hypothetical protein
MLLDPVLNGSLGVLLLVGDSESGDQAVPKLLTFLPENCLHCIKLTKKEMDEVSQRLMNCPEGINSLKDSTMLDDLSFYCLNKHRAILDDFRLELNGIVAHFQ